MKISDAKLFKIFGLDAYKDKYGEFIHDVKTELLEKQFGDVGNFIMDNMSKGLPVKEANYIVFIQINDELFVREMFNKSKGDLA